MQKILLLSALLLSSLPMLWAELSIGFKAPEFSLKDTSGKSHSLSDYEGRYVVLEWTNHTCPIVKKFYRKGHMQTWQKESISKGVVWFQVVSSAPGKSGYISPAEGESLRKNQKMASSAMLLDTDGAVGRSYGAKTTPHTYLIDPQGTLVYQGAIDSIRGGKTADIDRAENYLNKAIIAALSGDVIDPSTTKPYGCGIKY